MSNLSQAWADTVCARESNHSKCRTLRADLALQPAWWEGCGAEDEEVHKSARRAGSKHKTGALSTPNLAL